MRLWTSKGRYHDKPRPSVSLYKFIPISCYVPICFNGREEEGVTMDIIEIKTVTIDTIQIKTPRE